jgi:hypothetical protein
MLNNNLLYSTVIESDGQVHREETFGGAALATISLVALLVIVGALFL